MSQNLSQCPSYFTPLSSASSYTQLKAQPFTYKLKRGAAEEGLFTLLVKPAFKFSLSQRHSVTSVDIAT